MKLKLLCATLTFTLGLACTGLYAQSAQSTQSVVITDAWVRATVPGQKATGAFMKLTAKESTKLVAVSSPVAAVVEIHEMKVDNDIMQMRAMQDGLDLPAGKAVELKPGAYHVMLMDLKETLTKDRTIRLTLIFKDTKGVESKTEITLPVATTAPGSAPAAPRMGLTDMGHKH
ncbi:MAG: copper chaperone PCu(A)C [Rhodoferax sp.]|nr:copper chaperone PCu(A)C [Rhodoferax sp.]